ncbi:hypothetical protein JCM19000A_17720 [Silvimonas sp. JCM 19000]
MAQDSEFAVGTVVKLRSGGPDMTIRSIGTDAKSGKPTGTIICQWFAGKKLEQGTFPLTSVVLVEVSLKSAT